MGITYYAAEAAAAEAAEVTNARFDIKCDFGLLSCAAADAAAATTLELLTSTQEKTTIILTHCLLFSALHRQIETRRFHSHAVK